VGVDPVVFAVAAMDSLHVEGVAEDEGELLLGADVSKPVPDEHALNRDNDIFPVRCYCPKEGLRCGFAVLVEDGLALPVQDADVHGPGMKVDSAVELMLFGVESDWASSLGENMVGFAIPILSCL